MQRRSGDDLSALDAYVEATSAAPLHTDAIGERGQAEVGRADEQAMLATAAGLASVPLSHRRVPEWNDDTVRQSIVYSYRLIYRIRADDGLIQILAVIH